MLRPLMHAGCARRATLGVASVSGPTASAASLCTSASAPIRARFFQSATASASSSSSSRVRLNAKQYRTSISPTRYYATTPQSDNHKHAGEAASKGSASASSAPAPATSASASTPTSTTAHTHGHGHASHSHSHDSHGHAHGGIFHTHAHDHSEGAEQIMKAITSGRLDRGTKITLLGLGSNVALTISKGAAGLFMNSASLLAEAGHSLSDLLGDFVTLATWRISRKPPSDRFPWGYTKFETFGTLGVSVILVGGAIGIGLHSYHLLLQVLLPYLETLPAEHILAGLQTWLPSSVPSPLLEFFHAHGVHGHDHGHDHGHALEGVDPLAVAHGHESGALLNPHAAWFALASVLVKEWLYQLTNKVAKQENSPVLKANALHHRADALTSLVALGSIVGSSLGGYAWLDPLGGIAVSFFILQQGLSLTKQATMELLDIGIESSTQKAIEDVVADLVDGKDLLGCRNVRGVKSGGQIQLDLTIVVPAAMSVRDSHAIEVRVRDAIMGARRDTREVKVHVHGYEGETPARGDDPAAVPLVDPAVNTPQPNGINSDFTRHGC